MRLRKKKLKVDDIGAMDETPHDEFYFKEEAKRNLQDLAKELTERTKKETELIRQHLGIDDKGCCLRHPNQFITSPPLPYRRFETIKVCLICDSEIQAGGARQRKSMKNVILDLDQLIGDKAEWRKKTNVLYNGQEIPEEEDSEEEEDPNVFKKWVPPSDEKDNKEFGHNINFFNREVEEEQAKARRNKNKKKTKKQQQEETKGEEEEEASVLSEIIQKEDEKWKEEVKQRVAHVRAWDGDMALKQNPVYAKYWRMVNVGIPMQAIQNAMEMDGLDVRIMSLDPNRPLQDQVDDIPDMEEEEREKLRRNDQLALLRDDDIYEPLTIDETVAMIHRAYERRAYFMQELDDERNPEKQKLSNKFLKKLGKGVRAPPPPLIEPKRRELPPQPEEEEEEEEEEEKEEEKEEEPAAKASSSATKDEKTSRISFSANQQVVSTDDIDSSLKGEKPLVVVTPSSLSTITTLQPPPPLPAIKTSSTLGGPGSPSLKGSPTSMQSPPQPIAFFPESDDTMPAFPVDDGGTKQQRVKKKKPFKAVTKLGSTKYEVARSKQELHQAAKELAQRTVIIGSLQSQLEHLQKEFAQREREVERMKHELYELDPNDPLCNRTPQEQEQERNLVIDGPFRDIDRTDVVRARMAKLSILPVPLR